jgi:uncharacterized protein (TIGR02001 family)
MKLPAGLLTGTIPGLLAAGLAATPAKAQDVPEPSALTITGNVALVTDYRFRGVSQSGGDPAVQGAITLSHESGLYLGAWGSSIDFTRLGAAPDYGSMELDVTGGWTREIAAGLTADVGLGWYGYPGGHQGKANFLEGYGSLSTTYGPARLKLGANYAWPQDSLGSLHNLYLYTSADASIPSTPLTLSARLGYQDGPLTGAWIASGGTRTTGWDWSLGASATLFGRLTVGASYIGSSGRSLPGVTDDALVGTLTASF